MKSLIITAAILLLVLSSFTTNNQHVKDYLNIPGPIRFSNTSFNLAWSSHPSANYYKHEYVPVNEQPERFNKMIMIEALAADMSLPDAVKSKVAELEQRKKTDPNANYQLIENKARNEYMLDFVMSESAGSKNAIVEWNAYRYVNLKEKSGKNGVLLFAYSKRGYAGEAANFLRTLKATRMADIDTLKDYAIPNIKIN